MEGIPFFQGLQGKLNRSRRCLSNHNHVDLKVLMIMFTLFMNFTAGYFICIRYLCVSWPLSSMDQCRRFVGVLFMFLFAAWEFWLHLIQKGGSLRQLGSLAPLGAGGSKWQSIALHQKKRIKQPVLYEIKRNAGSSSGPADFLEKQEMENKC